MLLSASSSSSPSLDLKEIDVVVVQLVVLKARSSYCNQFALGEEGTFKEENSSSGEALASSLHN